MGTFPHHWYLQQHRVLCILWSKSQDCLQLWLGPGIKIFPAQAFQYMGWSCVPSLNSRTTPGANWHRLRSPEVDTKMNFDVQDMGCLANLWSLGGVVHWDWGSLWRGWQRKSQTGRQLPGKKISVITIPVLHHCWMYYQSTEGCFPDSL